MLTIFDSIRKEFSVNDKGESFCSRRAIARMSGKQIRTIRDLLKRISEEKIPHKILKPFTGHTFDGEELIPDTLASAIIQYYAFKGSETAQDYVMAFSAIGLRSAIQDATGWNKPKREYGNFLLIEPRKWTKMFGDEFYDEFSRLTGLSWDKKTHKRPCIFAQLTYELVYSHLPHSVYAQIKTTQAKHGGYIHKMHQFLNEEGLLRLQNHLMLSINILKSSVSIQEANRLIYQGTTGNYQPYLFS